MPSKLQNTNAAWPCSLKEMKLARDLYDHLEVANQHLGLAEIMRAIELAKWWTYVESPERDRPIGITPSLITYPVSRERLQERERSLAQQHAERVRESVPHRSPALEMQLPEAYQGRQYDKLEPLPKHYPHRR